MSTRRAAPPILESYEKEKPTRSRFVSFLLFLWKAFTCIFSHVTLITLVVAYCILGAFTFEHLEADNEREVKKGIVKIRNKITESIWKMTYEKPVLHQVNWTENAIVHLQDFENQIISAMKKDGWDGSEDDEQISWTFFGALFYSIIVITTIGYGHIAPKTHMGKISTIFYAILGIPLMLLCLSNIGDIMATSFRFLYWRVCCYVCTREPKRSRRSRSQRGTVRQGRSSTHSQPPPSIRRSIRTSQRSADSGIEFEPGLGLAHAYSEMDCRYDATNQQRLPRSNRAKGRYTIERDRNFNRNNLYSEEFDANGNAKPSDINLNKGNTDNSEIQNQRLGQNHRLSNSYHSGNKSTQNLGQRAQSLDRRLFKRDTDIVDLEEDDKCKTPVLCNKYALDDEDEPDQTKIRNARSQSIPRQSKYGDRLRAPSQSTSDKPPIYSEDTEIEMQAVRKGRRQPRPLPAPSPRIMSPMGFAVHRQARHLQAVIDDNSLDEDWENRSDIREKREMISSIVRPVPIWLCVFLVISYIIGGAFMFSAWEKWSLLDSAYFCFITLTTIGFGDFVPAQGVKDSQISIGLCSLYLLFGIALLAMSFNLVQEEVISNVKSVARRLGILKEEETEE